MKHTSEEIKYRLSDLGAQIGNIAIEYITELEKENAELKNRNQELLKSCEGATMMYEHLTKAKEQIQNLIKAFVGDLVRSLIYFDKEQLKAINEAEQFLKETEE